MKAKSTRRPAKQPSLWQKVRAWRPYWRWEWGPRQREAVGLVLLILAALAVLGLLRISSGSILGWWNVTARRLLGWVAFPLSLGVGAAGLWLLWQDLARRIPLGLSPLLGAELILLVLLAASHSPLILRLGDEQALLAAQLGQGGGLIGYVLAFHLIRGVGVAVGAVILLVALLLGLYLMIPVSWKAVRDWGLWQSRRVVAAFERWRMARQGTPVVAAPAEVPWWEQEPAPTAAEKPKRRPLAAKKQSPRSPRVGEGPLPSLDLLNPAQPHAYGDADARRKAQIVEETLSSFGVPAQVVQINQGPTVTQFGLEPGYTERRTAGGQVQRQRVRVSRIASLANDLALALAASPVRIEAPVPGRSVVGLEVPNETISLVSLRGVMESPEFRKINSRLAIALGENVSGHPVSVDLAMMPHLLIAGATGSGKSVCINAILCCLLLNNTPEDLQVLLVDPKMVELTDYNGLPHLLAPVIVEVEHVVSALAWTTRQMDERYKLFHSRGVRNLDEYNQRVLRRKDEDPLPTLVLLIDELADLMMQAPDEVERHICRVAQMGRATGIHLVVATQRPSVDVVTGLIKANFPARISFAVTSQVDSRVILDQGGAENLLGRGDMLFLSPQQAAPIRLQGCFVSDQEIGRLTDFWRGQVLAEEQASLFPPWVGAEGGEAKEADGLLAQAVKLAEGRQTVSTSFIQRQLHIGFPRAARLIDQLEELGIIGADEGAGRGRPVLPKVKFEVEKAGRSG